MHFTTTFLRGLGVVLPIGITLYLVVWSIRAAEALMKPLALYHGNPNVAVVDLSPAVCTEVCLCYLKNAKLSEAAHHFMVCTEMQRSKN